MAVDSRLLLRLREDGDGVGDLAVTSTASVRVNSCATPSSDTSRQGRCGRASRAWPRSLDAGRKRGQVDGVWCSQHRFPPTQRVWNIPPRLREKTVLAPKMGATTTTRRRESSGGRSSRTECTPPWFDWRTDPEKAPRA